MPVTVYRSSDASAPSIGRTTGSIITLLDACLVNGYGAKAAAGWTKSYSGTNAAVYRQGGNPQQYLYINDNVFADTAGNNSAPGIYGCQTATSITETDHKGRFPVLASTHPLIIKPDVPASNGAWKLFATDRAFYLFVKRDTWSAWSGFFFGATSSFYHKGSESDLGRNLIIAHDNPAPSSGVVPANTVLSFWNEASLLALAGHYFGGDAKGCIDGGIPASKFFTNATGVATIGNLSISAYDGFFVRGPVLSEVYALTGYGAMRSGRAEFRGIVPGMYRAINYFSHNPQDGVQHVVDSGPFAGKTVECVLVYGTSGTFYPYFISHSDWPE